MTNTTKSPGAQRAVAEVRALAVMLSTLGGTSTVAELAAKLGWTKQRTLTRLRSSSTAAWYGPRWRVYFEISTATAVKAPSQWRLTEAGRELVMGTEAAA